jgi:hypothetical protein
MLPLELLLQKRRHFSWSDQKKYRHCSFRGAVSIKTDWNKDEGAVSRSDTGEHGAPIVDDSYRQNLFLSSAN